MLRYKPKDAEVDPDNPRAWATCDRCGRVQNLYKLTWQHDYRGSFNLQNIRVLVCEPCYDVPQEQLRAYVLPPDPPMVFNIRPEAYVLDETSWLVTTEGAEIIDTQGGEEFITSLPNPATTAEPDASSIVEEAALNIETEDGDVIVTPQGDGNELDYVPNP